jgi:hypothetical protein
MFYFLRSKINFFRFTFVADKGPRAFKLPEDKSVLCIGGKIPVFEAIKVLQPIFV